MTNEKSPTSIPPFGRTQAVLAVCVQVVTLTGAICFLIGVALISRVFSAWGVNFLQIASTGDVINSGLDIVARMILPLMFICLAAVAGWSRPPTRRPWAMALAVAVLVVVAIYLIVSHFAGGVSARLLELYAPPPALLDQPLPPVRDLSQDEALLRRLGGLNQWRFLIGCTAQALLAYAVMAALSLIRRTRPATPQRRTARLVAALGLAGTLVALPVSAFLDVASDLSSRGFHDDMILAEDCNPRPEEFEPAGVLWIGERAMVLRCAFDDRVKLGSPSGEIGPRYAFKDWIDLQETQAQDADQAAWEKEMERP